MLRHGSRSLLAPARLSIAIWIVSFPIATLAWGEAVKPGPLSVEALLNRESLLSSAFSPDGKWVAIAVAIVGTAGNSPAATNVFTSDLRVIEVSTGKVVRLTPADSESDAYAWSPDGRTLAFDVETQTDHSLWGWNAADGSSRRIGDAQLSRGNLVWTQDGGSLIAALVPPRTSFRELRQGESVSNQAHALRRYEDALAPGANVIVYRSQSSGKNVSRATQDFNSNNRFRGDLARIDVQDHSITWLAGGMRPQSVHLSPDGRWVAFATLTGQAEGGGYRNLFDLVVVPSDGSSAARVIVTGIESIRTVLDFSWSPDSTRLAFNNVQSRGSSDPATADGCFIVDVANGSLRDIELQDRRDERGFSVSPYRTPLWSAAGDYLYLIGTRGLWRAATGSATASLFASLPGKRIRQIFASRRTTTLAAAAGNLLLTVRDDATRAEAIYEVDQASGATRLLHEDNANFSSSVAKLDISGDGRSVVYPMERADLPEQLWLADVTLRRRRPLTQLNPQLRQVSFGHSRLVSWKSAQGVAMQGALFLPAGYRAGKRYPLVVELYRNTRLSENVNLFGGSSGFSTPLHHTQLLATRGFAILESDSTASSTSGMQDIAASVMPGVDMLVNSGIVDPERIGVRGQSDGGYAALALVVQSPRFKAAVVSAGFSNLLTLYGQMHDDGTHWTMSWLERADNLGSTPWQQRQRYIDNSPFFFLDRVNTPLLLIHGTADTAVHPQLSDETFMALRRLGKDVEYAKYVDEGHVILSRANAKDAALRMLSWFETHLQPPSGQQSQ